MFWDSYDVTILFPCDRREIAPVVATPAGRVYTGYVLFAIVSG